MPVPVPTLSVSSPSWGSDVRTAGKQRCHGEEAGKPVNSSLKSSAKIKIVFFSVLFKGQPLDLVASVVGEEKEVLST